MIGFESLDRETILGLCALAAAIVGAVARKLGFRTRGEVEKSKDDADRSENRVRNANSEGNLTAINNLIRRVESLQTSVDRCNAGWEAEIRTRRGLEHELDAERRAREAIEYRVTRQSARIEVLEQQVLSLGGVPK